MLIPFSKMQAQGNDFVILCGLSEELPQLDWSHFARSVCMPHFGIGADGVVFLVPCPEADARMLIYNADGSRAKMCGSALRCIGWLLYESQGRLEYRVQTDSGLKEVNILPESRQIVVNLGAVRMLKQRMVVDSFTGDLVDIGNIHYINWVEEVEEELPRLYGADLEKHELFPEPPNVHFAHVNSRDFIQMNIWERGAGATLACGTGAGATVFSGIQRGLLDSEVRVQVPGGVLGVRYLEDSGEMLLFGLVKEVFTGVFPWKDSANTF